MKRVVGYLLAVIFGFGIGVVFTSEVAASSIQPLTMPIQQGTDAAYRDGYYMGKRDAEEGRANHVAAGRWSSDTDRAHYAAGYDDGYSTKSDE